MLDKLHVDISKLQLSTLLRGESRCSSYILFKIFITEDHMSTPLRGFITYSAQDNIGVMGIVTCKREFSGFLLESICCDPSVELFMR